MDEEARIAYMTVGMKIIEERKEAVAEEISHGIKSLVATVKKLKGTKADAIESIKEEYDKDEKDAKQLVEKYW